MAKQKEEKKEEGILDAEKGRELVTRCKRLEDDAQENRRKYDWEWLVRNLYVRGYHFARYNRGTSTVVFSTRSGVRIPINLVNAHLRGVRNQVTSFQPKWEVMPNVTTESAFENARYSGKTLDWIYEKSQIKRKIKEIVTDALIYSVGIWQFDVDDKKNIVVNRVDPFDTYIDPNCKTSNINDPEYGAEFVILAHQVPLELIKNNPHYENIDDLQGDNEVAAAEYKRFLLQVTSHQFKGTNKENETKILKQAFLRERQDNGEIKIRIVTYVDDIDKPIRNELTEDSDYPFEILQGDIVPGSLYGESWIKHLIPINRVIDQLESHIFEYNHFFAKGRFIVDKNSGVRIIVNQHGQIIEKNRGSQVTPITVPPLPPSPQEQLISMKRHLEDVSGVHDVSLGRLPGTLRSGVAIAELKQADATNQADLVDNLEDFLSRAGKKILKLVSENWDTTRLITITGLGGKQEYFMAQGGAGKNGKQKSKFKFGEMELPLATIGADNEVKVQIGSWLAYTKEARQERLKELFRLGAIDQRTYLEYSEFADIDGILERTRSESILQARRGQPSQVGEAKFGVSIDDESQALAENELMLEGTQQFVEAEDDHQVHLEVHKEEQDNALVKAHINEHIKIQRWKQSMEGQSVEEGGPQTAPEAGPETFQMNPPVGPGAPPFVAGEDIIQ